MSGLFKSITNAVSSVINTVADTVTNTVKGALKDPIGTIAKVAAVATGNAWALPLISGADTLAHGGSVGAALKSAGTSYVAGQVAGAVSSGLDGAMGTGAAAEGAASNAAPSIFARVAGNAAGTAVAGGNPLNALISGGIGAGVGELTGQIPGFDSLPALAQTAIRNAMSSSLSSSLMGGQQPTQANVNSALAAGQAAAGTGSPMGQTGMYRGDPLITPKLETVAEAPPPSGLDALPGATPPITAGLTSPLTKSIVTPMTNMLGTPNNNLGTPNLGNDMNTAYGMGTMGPPNTMGNSFGMGNTYGMGGLNQMGGAYGVNNGNQMAQNGQMPMYAEGGAIQHFADGGDADSSKDMDFATILKSLGAVTGPAISKQSGLMQLGQMGSPFSKVHSDVIPSLIEALRSRGIHLAHGGQPEEHPDDQSHPNYDGSPVFRTGGSNGLGGKYVEGKGDGTSDDISAMLANGEYVFSADVVSALGNGSNKAGADKLGEMVEAIRARARSSAPDKLPPDAKSPLEYLKSSRGNKHG